MEDALHEIALWRSSFKWYRVNFAEFGVLSAVASLCLSPEREKKMRLRSTATQRALVQVKAETTIATPECEVEAIEEKK